jgi:DNA-binding SARP family transcriptional activator
MDSGDGLRIGVLGPVEAWVNGRRVALGGQRPRALLAVLALMRGRVVTSERLIDEVWGEDPPARAVTACRCTFRGCARRSRRRARTPTG